MIIVCVNKSTPNFGDCIADVFFAQLAEKETLSVPHDTSIESYLTVGSHLRIANTYHTIIGSGFISENDDLGKGDWNEYTNTVYSIPKKIISVRGPKTREKMIEMGVDCPQHYGDPLFLFPLIYLPKTTVKYKIGLIPHYIDKKSPAFLQLYRELSSKYTIKLIDIETGENYKKFIDDISECETIISSTLHGVILSLAYFKKTIWTRFSDKVIGGDFKFQDFFASLYIQYKDVPSNDPKLLESIIQVEKSHMFNIGLDILNCCPFIQKKRLELLNKLWLEYINTHDFT